MVGQFLPMPGITDVVARHAGRHVYLDTNLFIYVLNGAPGVAEQCVGLLDACCRDEVHGVTGDLTLAELLVQPLIQNDVAAVRAMATEWHRMTRDVLLAPAAEQKPVVDQAKPQIHPEWSEYRAK